MALVGEGRADDAFARRGCCLWVPFLESEWARTECGGERWWRKGWRKVREWSEVVAGPRWKTFIRRFNRRRGERYGGGGKFQYDPLSYAMNFDEGHGQNGHLEEDDGGFRDFSARFAAPPVTAKSSMDATAPHV